MIPLPKVVPDGTAGALRLADVRLPCGGSRLALSDSHGAVVLLPEGAHAFLAALFQAAAHGIPGLDSYALPEDTLCDCAPDLRGVRIRQPGGEIFVARADLLPLAQALDARSFLP
jgi:hypothetical protein